MAGEFDVFLNGFRPEAETGARESLQKLFGVDPTFATRMLETLPRSVKSKIPLESAERYVEMLESIGGVAELRPSIGVDDLLPPAGASEVPSAQDMLGPQSSPSRSIQTPPPQRISPAGSEPAVAPPDSAFAPPASIAAPAAVARAVDPFAPPEMQHEEIVLELADAVETTAGSRGSFVTASASRAVASRSHMVSPAAERVSAAVATPVAVSGGQAVRASAAGLGPLIVAGCIAGIIGLRVLWVGGTAVDDLLGHGAGALEPGMSEAPDPSQQELYTRDGVVGLGGEKFGETAEAVVFIEDPKASIRTGDLPRVQIRQLVFRLYELGAPNVMFGQIEHDGARRVSALLIAEMPAPEATRKQILGVWNAVTRGDQDDIGQSYLALSLD